MNFRQNVCRTSNVEVAPPLDQFKVHLSFEIKDGELNMQKQ